MEASTTVLVLDDDASIRLLCRINLELDGHEVAEAASLSEARAIVAERPLSVAVLDVHVTGGDGRELLRELRESRPELPVALLTGTADQDELLRAGADALIPKPFTIDELRETVRRLASVGRLPRA